MKMQDILKRTPQSRMQGASYCVVKSSKRGRTSYGTVVYSAKVYSTHDHNFVEKKYTPVTHVTTVETNIKEMNPNKRMVVVSCSCDDFKFVWEFALNKRRAARLDYCNGEPPVDTNPRLIPGCCRHIACFSQKLLRKGYVE